MTQRLSLEQFKALTVAEKKNRIRQEGLKGYSKITRSEDLDRFYANPPANPAAPGRPPKGSKVGSPLSSPKRAVTRQSNTVTVNYDEQGLNSIGKKFLAQLIKSKNVSGHSNKKKAEIVGLLLLKGHHHPETLSIVKDGVTETVIVLPTSRSMSIPKEVAPVQQVAAGAAMPQHVVPQQITLALPPPMPTMPMMAPVHQVQPVRSGLSPRGGMMVAPLAPLAPLTSVPMASVPMTQVQMSPRTAALQGIRY